MRIADIALRWVALMRDVLGYERFAAAGGDWGASISAELGHAHAQHLLGVYLTSTTWPGLDVFKITRRRSPLMSNGCSRGQADGWRRARRCPDQRIGQQTLAYALVDSPTGPRPGLGAPQGVEEAAASGDVLAVFDRDFLCKRRRFTG